MGRGVLVDLEGYRSATGAPIDHAAGMPLGELWKLGPLARHMRTAGTWEAFVSIKPLNIVGGTGSPANAIALL